MRKERDTPKGDTDSKEHVESAVNMVTRLQTVGKMRKAKRKVQSKGSKADVTTVEYMATRKWTVRKEDETKYR